MPNITLLKHSFRMHRHHFMIITILLCLCMVLLSFLWTPSMQDVRSHISHNVWKPFLLQQTTYLQAIQNIYYLYIASSLPLLYTLLLNHRSMVTLIDRGHRAWYCSAPLSRTNIAMTTVFFQLLSHLLMWIIVFIVGYVAITFFQLGVFDVEWFLRINITYFCYHIVVSSLCFLISCICHSSRYAVCLTTGISILSLVLFINGLLHTYEWLDVFTMLHGVDGPMMWICMIVVAMLFYGLGIVVFHKKDLSIASSCDKA